MKSYLKDLLLESKDGDWGVEHPEDGFERRRVIRGTDFPRVRRGDLSTVPLRHLKTRTVGRRTLQAGDILLETAGGSKGKPTGKTLLLSTEQLDAFDAKVIGASFTRFLRPNPDVLDSRYLYWWFQDLYQRGETYEYQVQHTGVARFQYTVFAESRELDVPPLAKQAAVSEILGALDDKIAANERAVAASEELAVAIALSATAQTSLEELALRIAKSLKPSEFGDQVSHFSLPAFDEDAMPEITNQTEIKSNKFLLAEPCVLVSKLNPRIPRIWNVVEVPPEMSVASTEFVALTPKEVPVSSLWSALMAPAVSREMQGLVAGTSGSHQRVKPEELLSIDVPDPRALTDSERRQQDSLGRYAYSLRKQNVALVRTRDELLPLLMSGKITVRDAEMAVSNAV